MEEKIPAAKIIQVLTARLLMKLKIVSGADTTLPAPSWMKTKMESATDAALPAPSWTKTATASATDTVLPVLSWTKTVTASATDRAPALSPAKDAITAAEPTAARTRDAVTDNPKTLTMRSPEEIDRAMELYADTVRRICMVYLKNYADTEDIFQTVFLKYLQKYTCANFQYGHSDTPLVHKYTS